MSAQAIGQDCSGQSRHSSGPQFCDGETCDGDRSDLEIKITKHRKFTTLYDTYVVFTLVTDTNRREFGDCRHFEVERRYSEFEWLHSRLSHAHPALFVPPLPGKMAITTLDRFAEIFLTNRKQGLQAFLSRLARHPLLSADPDLIAFLSLLRDDFSQYRTNHQSASALSNMFSETRRCVMNRVQAAPYGEDQNNASGEAGADAASEPTDLDVGLIGSKAMEQYEQEFRSYSDETECFISVAQRMARVTEIVVSNLEGLGYGFEELCRCLESWPPRLIVEVDGQSNVTDPEALIAHGSQSGRGALQWSRERPVAPEALNKAARLASSATTELAGKLRTEVLADWKETAAYAQCVRSVLNTRDNLEKRYFDTVEELKNETDPANRKQESRLTAIAKSYLPWRQRSTSELASEACRLQDDLTLANGQIRAEFTRWVSERRQDTVGNLLQMSSAYLSYWTGVAEAWRDAITVLERGRPRTAVRTVQNDQIPGNSHASIQHSADIPEPRILNRLTLDDDDIDSDEFFLAPAEIFDEEEKEDVRHSAEGSLPTEDTP